jgi:hypothetical protein
MTTMIETDRKLLTEYLGECWHDYDWVNGVGWKCKCGHEAYLPDTFKNNRTFTTREDMMDLYEVIWKKREWEGFIDYSGNEDTEHDCSEFETTLDIFASMAAWLFCLSGSGYDAACQRVADWIKEANHADK